MYLDNRSVAMVGSVPCETAEEVLGLVGPALGDLLVGLPDGEPGYRNKWIVFNGPHVYEPHPDIEVTNKPKPRPEKSVFKDLPDWVPTSWDEMWQFRVRDGVERIQFDNLHYAEFAIGSYEKFTRLRAAGQVPATTRFQVSLPMPEDFTRWCTSAPRDFHIMTQAVEDALANELGKILVRIPHDDLVIQWDVCWEVFACDTGDCMGREPLAWKADGDPYERFAAYVGRLWPLIPEKVVLGMHLCYGDLEHSHLIEPQDLAVCVRMANLAIAHAGRRVDYVQMPVPRTREDDAYYAPLEDLRAADTKLFAGLVHLTDGVDGATRRLRALRRHYAGRLGVATECGWGRRKRETIPGLMQLHRDVAALL
ncbi:MAG: hypothetical protein ABI859_12915 [Pseudomonadota bacterium]